MVSAQPELKFGVALLQPAALVFNMSDSAYGFGWLQLLEDDLRQCACAWMQGQDTNKPPGFECRHELVQDGFVDLL